MRRPRVLYVDFNETANHADMLFSVVRFLEGCAVRWLFDPAYRGFLPAGIDESAVVWLPRDTGQWAAVRSAMAAARELRRFDPDVVHVNSARGRRTRAFALLAAGSRARFSGTHHNPGRMAGSTSQKLINRRIRRYGVLADYIRDAVAPTLPQGIEVRTIRQVVYPAIGVGPPEDRLRVIVVGSLSAARRDYSGLARLLSTGPPLDPRVEIVFAGNSTTPEGRGIRADLLSTPAAPRLRFFDGFLSFDALFQEVETSHVVLPLIHPDTPRFAEYAATKVSGATLLALGFRKPLLLHTALAGLSDYRDVALGYEAPDLVERLNRLAAEPGPLDAIASAYRARTDLDAEAAAVAFRELLGIPEL
jgi:hypothetical protein